MTLQELNKLNPDKLEETLYRCCGSSQWVQYMLPQFPMEDLIELLDTADQQWQKCKDVDFKEAFAQHPRIGEKKDIESAGATAKWAASEQGGVEKADKETLNALQQANQKYYNKFGYIFIVCATGLSANEMLARIIARLKNEPGEEIRIAAEEQNKITKLRLKKLLEA
jgi:2-oxo-4-hydroxy-4-carboxy-5-ureidoimidazoline decarboxylase